MKKVSEVKEQIDKLGCDTTQRDRITDTWCLEFEAGKPSSNFPKLLWRETK